MPDGSKRKRWIDNQNANHGPSCSGVPDGGLALICCGRATVVRFPISLVRLFPCPLPCRVHIVFIYATLPSRAAPHALHPDCCACIGGASTPNATPAPVFGPRSGLGVDMGPRKAEEAKRLVAATDSRKRKTSTRTEKPCKKAKGPKGAVAIKGSSKRKTKEDQEAGKMQKDTRRCSTSSAKDTRHGQRARCTASKSSSSTGARKKHDKRRGKSSSSSTSGSSNSSSATSTSQSTSSSRTSVSLAVSPLQRKRGEVFKQRAMEHKAGRLVKLSKKVVKDQRILRSNKKYIKNLLERIKAKRRTLSAGPTFTAEEKLSFTIASDCSGLGTDHIAAKKARVQKIRSVQGGGKILVCGVREKYPNILVQEACQKGLRGVRLANTMLSHTR